MYHWLSPSRLTFLKGSLWLHYMSLTLLHNIILNNIPIHYKHAFTMYHWLSPSRLTFLKGSLWLHYMSLTLLHNIILNNIPIHYKQNL